MSYSIKLPFYFPSCIKPLYYNINSNAEEFLTKKTWQDRIQLSAEKNHPLYFIALPIFNDSQLAKNGEYLKFNIYDGLAFHEWFQSRNSDPASAEKIVKIYYLALPLFSAKKNNNKQLEQIDLEHIDQKDLKELGFRLFLENENFGHADLLRKAQYTQRVLICLDDIEKNPDRTKLLTLVKKFIAFSQNSHKPAPSIENATPNSSIKITLPFFYPNNEQMQIELNLEDIEPITQVSWRECIQRAQDLLHPVYLFALSHYRNHETIVDLNFNLYDGHSFHLWKQSIPVDPDDLDPDDPNNPPPPIKDPLSNCTVQQVYYFSLPLIVYDQPENQHKLQLQNREVRLFLEQEKLTGEQRNALTNEALEKLDFPEGDSDKKVLKEIADKYFRFSISNSKVISKTSMQWLIHAAYSGHTEAQLELLNNLELVERLNKNNLLFTDKYKEIVDYINLDVRKNIFELFDKFNKQNNTPEGQHCLAVLYAKGYGCNKNEKAAFEWFEKAANQNYALAQSYLASMYEEGCACNKDMEKCVFWLEKAADQGDEDSINNLTFIYTQHFNSPEYFAKAFTLYQKNADKSFVSKYFLALLFHEGTGCDKNLKKAFDLFLDVANWDYEKAKIEYKFYHNYILLAQCQLSECFDKGIGCQMDKQQAFEWCLKASKEQYPMAQYMLATYLENGNGCDKDLKQALECYQKAADQGYAPAREYLQHFRLLEELEKKSEELENKSNELALELREDLQMDAKLASEALRQSDRKSSSETRRVTNKNKCLPPSCIVS